MSVRPTPDFRSPPVRSVRILLVEDDAPFAELVRENLGRVDWAALTLTHAATLKDALARLAAGAFDLIITDLDLPDSKGLDTLQGLAGAGEHLIIVLSGANEERLREQAIRHGAYDFINKDHVGRAELAKLVRLATLQANVFRSLRESEERFRSLAQLSSDLYWEQDDQYRFTQVADHGPEQLGSGRGPVLGSTRWQREYFNMSAADWRAHRALLDARQPFRDLELGRINAGGNKIWVSVS